MLFQPEAAFKYAAVTFFYVNEGFSWGVWAIAAVNLKGLTFFAFAGVVNFHLGKLVGQKIFFGKNTERKTDIFAIIHVMRHIYMAVADNLVINKFVFCKI